MKDLREAHLGRSDSASNVMLFCTQTKIKYHKLTEEEKQWLVRIAQKSELSKSHVSQRGRKC